MKYSARIRDKITEALRHDTYTAEEIAHYVGISRSTFFEWKNTKSDFSDAIKKAEEERDEMLLAEAKRSLKKKLTGYDVVETKSIYSGKTDANGDPILKEKTTITKHIPSDTAAIIFVMTNREPDKWKRNNPGDISDEGEDMRHFEITMKVMDKKEQE